MIRARGAAPISIRLQVGGDPVLEKISRADSLKVEHLGDLDLTKEDKGSTPSCPCFTVIQFRIANPRSNMTEPDGVGFSDREMVLLTTMAHLARATLHKNLSEATLIATKLIDHYAPYEVDDVVLKLNIPCNTAIDRIEAQREKEKGLTQ